MTVVVVGLIVFVLVLSCFVAYWAGRDAGETAVYRKSRIADEARTRTIIDLQLEIESLRLRVNGLENEVQTFYPPSVWNNYKAAMRDVGAALDQSYDES